MDQGPKLLVLGFPKPSLCARRTRKTPGANPISMPLWHILPKRTPALSTHSTPPSYLPKQNNQQSPCNFGAVGKHAHWLPSQEGRSRLRDLAGIAPHGPSCFFPGTLVAVAQCGDSTPVLKRANPPFRFQGAPNSGHPMYVVLGIMHCCIRGEDFCKPPSFWGTGRAGSSVASDGWSSTGLSEPPLQGHGWAPWSGDVPSSHDARDPESLFSSTAGRLNQGPLETGASQARQRERRHELRIPESRHQLPGTRASEPGSSAVPHLTFRHSDTRQLVSREASLHEEVKKKRKTKTSDETRQ